MANTYRYTSSFQQLLLRSHRKMDMNKPKQNTFNGVVSNTTQSTTSNIKHKVVKMRGTEPSLLNVMADWSFMAFSIQFKFYHAVRVITYCQELYFNKCKFWTEYFKVSLKTRTYWQYPYILLVGYAWVKLSWWLIIQQRF